MKGVRLRLVGQSTTTPRGVRETLFRVLVHPPAVFNLYLGTNGGRFATVFPVVTVRDRENDLTASAVDDDDTYTYTIHVKTTSVNRDIYGIDVEIGPTIGLEGAWKGCPVSGLIEGPPPNRLG